MTQIRFEHFMTFTSADNIDDYIKEYARQGFMAEAGTARHPYGLRNGWVSFGPDYLEFCWVEDAALFSTGNDELHALRMALRPYGIGMLADDAQAVHDALIVRGYALPEVESRVPRDAPPGTLPAWSIQDIPRDILPGVLCFAVSYHARPKDMPWQVQVPPNTIYAISGATFVTAEPETRAAHWRDVLVPEESVQATELGSSVRIGPHHALWMTPAMVAATYGLSWTPASHERGELALLHLLAADLEIARTMLQQAGRQTRSIHVKGTRGEEALLVAPDARDGFTFLIRQQPVATWLQARTARTGETIHWAQDAA